jgi:recombination protein RecT
MDNALITKFETQLQHFEKKVLTNLLVHHNMHPAQFKQIVLTEIKKSPQMLEAFRLNPTSLFGAIIHCAELGLSPSQQLGEFFFIPYRGHIRPILGYKGLVTLLLRNNGLKTIMCESVHEADDFEYELGLDPILKHVPKDEIRTSFTLTHIYCVVKTRDDEKPFKVLSKAELEKIVSNLTNANDLYWNDKKDSQFWMLKKIVLKQLAKLLPKDNLGLRALAIDDQMEGGAVISLDDNEQVVVLDDKKPQVKSKGLYDSLAIEE